jgi:hypothetical protein
MSTFNVMSTSGRPQVLIDEQQFQQLQAEAARRGIELERLKAAMETLSAFNAPVHFLAAAMALVNEIAARWKCDRAGIGFLQGRYVRLRALSHTEKITRNMQLVQDIEAAMEECLDQDVEIVVPPPKEASFVYRAADNLASQHGPNAVISFPLRRERTHLKERADERFGNVVAVLTVERKFDKPFSLGEVETLRLTADLFTARLYDLYENDRWIGAKALRGTRRALAWVVGAKHTWAKVAAIIVAGFLGFAFFFDGTFRVEAPFAIQAIETQVVTAPFEGFLKTSDVEPGDLVITPASAAAFDDLNAASRLAPIVSVKRPASVLATLNTDELAKQLYGAQQEVIKYEQASKRDFAEGKIAESQQDDALQREAQAKVDELTWKIDHATVITPIDGIVFQGDLRTKLGAPVRAGDQLFEIGQADLRSELDVSEDQISEVRIGQKGTLKATSYPDRPIHFTVDRIYPVAVVADAKNVFKVRVQFDPGQDTHWLKPGVQGLAKIDVPPKRRYAWIWTHRMINWVRMKLWM